jgi:hypothetical protein
MTTVDNGRHALAEIIARCRMGIDCIICPSSCVHSPRNILDNHQSRDAGAFACTLLTNFNLLNISSKVLLAAAIIVFVEKLFLNVVAINFHLKALADRLEENRLGLKALDSLSKAHPVATKKTPYHKRGHKRMSSLATIDLATLSHQGGEQQDDSSTTRGHHTTLENDSRLFPSKTSPELRPKRRTKKVTSVIVNQVRPS